MGGVLVCWFVLFLFLVHDWLHVLLWLSLKRLYVLWCMLCGEFDFIS